MNIVNIVDDDNNVISHKISDNWVIRFIGDNNMVVLHKDLRITNLRMTLGSNMTITIEKSENKMETIL